MSDRPTNSILPSSRPEASPLSSMPSSGSMLQALDGSKLRWGGADTPGPLSLMPAGAPASIAIAVSPVRPGHAVTVEYRVNGGPVRETAAQPDYRIPAFGERMFRAAFPALLDGLVEFLPVLRFAGQPISPRLSNSIEPSRFQIGRAAANNASAPTPNPSSGPPTREPSWGCETKVPRFAQDIPTRAADWARAGRAADQLVCRGRNVSPALTSVASCCLVPATGCVSARTESRS